MNLPNKLTLTRILLVPVFMVFVSLTSLSGIADGSFQPTYYLIAGIVFAAASFTDFLDGHLARKWNMVTDFGKFADPLADKLLTTVAFIYMMRDGVCSPVVLCIILAREFAVSGLRMVAAGAKDGKVIAANMWGKVKTVLQMLSIIFYFFGMAIAANVSLGCHGHGCGSLGGAVLAGGCRDGHFRHQIPVGQPQLHQHRKIKLFLKKGRETCPFSNFRGNITRRKGFP
ncbi:MAG: CDP-diacylglycerol--glycerol-3-phosphate 3-phosphatidyltransferase [Faecalibacterium sp.]